MTERRRSRVHQATVRRTSWLTPHMIRVVLGGDDLAEFEVGAFSDHYLKLLFPHPEAEHPTPLDLDAVRRDLPREYWPRTRTYTVRGWQPTNAELTVDFVYHGDEGLAGPWAAGARPGDQLMFMGPGGSYAPSREVDWHLLVGDESALPAIAASVERLPEGVPARVFIEIDGPDEEQKLSISDTTDLVWVHRGDRPIGDALVDVVDAADFLPGRLQAFVHGEAHFVKRLRHLLRVDRGIERDQLSISGYWRRGSDEDGWRTSKREWNERVELDEARALAHVS